MWSPDVCVRLSTQSEFLLFGVKFARCYSGPPVVLLLREYTTGGLHCVRSERGTSYAI